MTRRREFLDESRALSCLATLPAATQPSSVASHAAAYCRVVALVPSAALREALLAAGGDDVSVSICSDLSTFERRIGLTSVDRVILELGSGISAETCVQIAMRVVAPSRIVALCTLSPASMHEAAVLARSGVTRIAIHGHDDLAPFLRAPIEEPTIDDIGARLEAATRARVTGPPLELLLICLETARREGTVNAAAGVLGVHRVTLVRQLRHVGLPQPKTVVRGYRLLLAAGLIEYTTQLVSSACAAAGFSSYAVFRRVLARYTGLRPTSLRCRGQFDRMTQLTLDAMLPDTLRHAGVHPMSAAPRWTASGSR